MFREDWVQRQVKALSDLIARVAGLLRSGQPHEAIALVQSEAMRVLGADPEVLAVVDERTVFVLLGNDPARVVRYAALLALEADALEASGDIAGAAHVRARASSLHGAALDRAEQSVSRS